MEETRCCAAQKQTGKKKKTQEGREGKNTEKERERERKKIRKWMRIEKMAARKSNGNTMKRVFSSFHRYDFPCIFFLSFFLAELI